MPQNKVHISSACSGKYYYHILYYIVLLLRLVTGLSKTNRKLSSKQQVTEENLNDSLVLLHSFQNPSTSRRLSKTTEMEIVGVILLITSCGIENSCLALRGIRELDAEEDIWA